ncbi:MAG: hypothetical protein JSR40_11075 [Proteobacteria bacterium]|nr:hypothetical protein [Pseudomonadota bacterium]
MDDIAGDNPAVAVELDDAFEEKAELARQCPALNRPGRTPGTREIAVRPNDSIVCRSEDDGNAVAMRRVVKAPQRESSAPQSIAAPGRGGRGGDVRRTDAGMATQLGARFPCHVAALQRPFVVRLEPQGGRGAKARGLVRDDPDDVGAGA